MKFQLIGIFDRKAQTFISLEPTPAIAVSVRALTERVNATDDNPIAKWPADYSMWELGTWDSETGEAWPRSDDPHRVTRTWDPDTESYEKKLIVECESLKNA